MLKIEFDAKKKSQIEAHGSSVELVADLGMVVGSMYSMFKGRNEGLGEVFKIAILSGLGADSPIWEGIPGGVGICLTDEEKERYGGK